MPEPISTGESMPINPERQAKWDEVSVQIAETRDSAGKSIDSGIIETVVAFNALGYTTDSSCEGHIDKKIAAPRIEFLGGDRNSELLQRTHEAYEALHSAHESGVTEEELMELHRLADGLDSEYRRPTIDLAKKLMDLMGEFYKDKQIPEDVRLRIEFLGVDVVRLESSGAFLQEIADSETKAAKLREYQAEMAKFGEFLKAKFFNS